jgi:hypothetical protein
MFNKIVLKHAVVMQITMYCHTDTQRYEVADRQWRFNCMKCSVLSIAGWLQGENLNTKFNALKVQTDNNYNI